MRPGSASDVGDRWEEPESALRARRSGNSQARPRRLSHTRPHAAGHVHLLALPAPRPRRPRSRSLALATPRPELAALLRAGERALPLGLDRNGFANEYYSAAVRSMSTSWHAFLYGSFDSAGVMTVDKPPLALWVQALSARVFGFSSWSMLVPQALMGVATVALAYDLTRRRFGRIAGFTAGLALALTPITVAIARHNNPDALLVLCCAAALWAVVRGLEDGRTRWLVLARRRASASASRRRWRRRCWSCPRSPRRGCGSLPAGAPPPCASCSPAAPR